MGFTRFYWVWLSFNRFPWTRQLFLAAIEFHKVLLDRAQFDLHNLMSYAFTEFRWYLKPFFVNVCFSCFVLFFLRRRTSSTTTAARSVWTTSSAAASIWTPARSSFGRTARIWAWPSTFRPSSRTASSSPPSSSRWAWPDHNGGGGGDDDDDDSDDGDDVVLFFFLVPHRTPRWTSTLASSRSRTSRRPVTWACATPPPIGAPPTPTAAPPPARPSPSNPTRRRPSSSR